MFGNKRKEKLLDWLANWSNKIDEYSGNLRNERGVFKKRRIAFHLSDTSEPDYDTVVIDETIKLNNNQNYHLLVEKQIEKDKAKDIINIDLSVKAGQRRRIEELEKQGFKVNVYNINDKGQSVVAIKDTTILTDIEKEFIEIDFEYKFRPYKQ